MSNTQNQEIMERLYDEAYKDLWGSYWINNQQQHHEAAVKLAQHRWETDAAFRAFN
jgi:hypothetical protein